MNDPLKQRAHNIFVLMAFIGFSLIIYPIAAFAASEVSIGDAVKKFAESTKRVRIAVFDFANTDGSKTRFDAYIADTIVSELSKYPVTLLERKRLETLLGEQALSQTGVVDSNQALKLGTLLPVDVVVSGSYTGMGNRLIINGRFIHVGTGEILSAFTSSIEATLETNKAAVEEKKKGNCEEHQERVHKALYDFKDPDAIKRAVDVALSVPFDEECRHVHFGIMYTFARHKIFDERYKAFLIRTIRSLEMPSDDNSAQEILHYFAEDGRVDQEEWEAALAALKKMRNYALHIPLRYMLNSDHETITLVMARVDEIMGLTASGKIGRPVPVQQETMLFSILEGLRVRIDDTNKDPAIAVFRKYSTLIPDDDKNNKKAVGILRSCYFDNSSPDSSRSALSLLIDFLKGRAPSKETAESTADLAKSIEAKIEDRYNRDEKRGKAYQEDLKTVAKSLEDLYCMSIGESQKQRTPYITDERWLFALKNGMHCKQVAGISDLEQDMRSGDWDRKLKAAEFFSKMGDAAKEAEGTVVKYLGQKGFGYQGGTLRRYCAETLGNIRTSDPRGITLLIEAFPDYDNGVSHAAEEAIQKIGINALPYLIKGLGNKEHAVRLRCAKALGELGARAKEALPELQRLADKDVDPYVRDYAKSAAQMIQNDF